MHKSAILFYLLVSFLLGVGLTSFLNVPVSAWYAGLIISLVLIVFFWPMRAPYKFARLKIRSWRHVLYVFLMIFFIVGGLKTQTLKLNRGILSEFAEKEFPVAVRGYIDDETEDLGNRQRFIFRAKELELPDIRVPIDEKILVTALQYPEYFYGDQLEIKGKLKLPQNYNGFDYKTFLAREQIFTTIGFPAVKEFDARLNLWEKVKIVFFEKIFLLKKNFQKSIQSSISEPNAAFINGILLGTRTAIPKELKDDFAKTSITHVLAISGYNITIVAAIVSWLLLLFFSRKVSFWFSVFAILTFAVLTGASASVMRAAVMGLLVILARSSGRLYHPRNALTLAAAAMIWLNPLSLRFDIGFQLSFLATAGILFVVPLFEKYLQKLPKLLNFRETFLMTLSAQLMVLPLMLFYFHNFSLIALPANLVVLPLIPFAMLLGFLTGIAGMFWNYLGLAVGAIAWLITSFEIIAVKFFANIPHTAFQISIPRYVVIIFYILIIYALYTLNKKQKVRSLKINE